MITKTRQMARVSAWFPPALCCAAVFLLGAAPSGAERPKISGEIALHRLQKLRAANEPGLRQPRAGMAKQADGTASASVVLYVPEVLPEAAIAAYAARGIRIEPSSWVPPVPGRHPHGFYLAVADYAALPPLEADPNVVRVASAERRSEASNDVGGDLVGSNDVQAGLGLITKRDGTGVRVAIADSGIDLSHPDLPRAPMLAYDVTDGDSEAEWGNGLTDPQAVRSVLYNHGMHVAGIILATGASSSGRYKGVAPGATWGFYKIEGDTGTGGASEKDQIEAITHAASRGFDVFNMSFAGGFAGFQDGSEKISQAIDAAVGNGMNVFISAGNFRNWGHHMEGRVPYNDLDPATVGTSPVFSAPITRLAGKKESWVDFNLVWRDGNPNDENLSLRCTNLQAGESLAFRFSEASNRGTERKYYTLSTNLADSASRTYDFVVDNVAGSGGTVTFHCYLLPDGNSAAAFLGADPGHTLGSTACADLAIAVAAHVHRNQWVDFRGILQNSGQTLGTFATFSSAGPRIDGREKPEISAPGASTISLLCTYDQNSPPATWHPTVFSFD